MRGLHCDRLKNLRESRPLFWLVMAFCLLLLCYSRAPGQTPAPYMAIAEIRHPGWAGSGTLIAKHADGRGLMLSCRHVNPSVGAESAVSWIWSEHTARGQTVSVVKGDSFHNDLAFVVTDTVPPGVESVSVATLNEAGLPIWAAGYRNGTMRVTRPTLYAEMRPDGLIGIDRSFVPGMSGGPLFNRFGEVVGVVVASDMKMYGLSVDGPLLQRFVDAWVKR